MYPRERRPRTGDDVSWEGQSLMGKITSVRGDDVLVSYGPVKHAEWMTVDDFSYNWNSTARRWELPNEDEEIDEAPWVTHAQRIFDVQLYKSFVPRNKTKVDWLASLLCGVPKEDHRHKIVEAMRNGEKWDHIRASPVTNRVGRIDVDSILGPAPEISEAD